MNELEVEKCLYNVFSTRMQGNGMTQPTLAAEFQILSGELMRDYAEVVDKIINNFIDKHVLIMDQLPGRFPILRKGINFDEWEEKMNPQKSSISIGSVTAQNVQLGNENTMNIGTSTEQLVKAMALLRDKPEDEKKSIIDEFISAVGKGVNLAEAVSKLIMLIGG